MVIFSGAKINLGLQILRKRSDGYHDLSTCFFPIKWSDVVEVLPSAGPTSLHGSGIIVPGLLAQNLVYKAWQLLSDLYKIPTVDIYCHKVVPMGAGLGGGSADAVAVLKACNELFGIGLDTEQLCALALWLGSDCPFFVEGQPTLAGGRGEVFEPINLDLSGYQLVVVHPGVSVSTAQAFSQVKPNAAVPDIAQIIRQPVGNWQSAGLRNDFEASVFPQLPVVAALKQQLLDLGAVYAAMSGSGSAVYGLFDQPIDPCAHFDGLAWHQE